MKKPISLVLALMLLLASCSSWEVAEKKFYNTFEAKEWYVSSKDSVMAVAEGDNVSFLSFKNPWRISEISAKKWDVVKAWQILAKLSNEEWQISYAWASSIIDWISKMWVDISSMWADTSKIRSAVESMYDGKLSLINKDYEKARLWLGLAEKDLELAKSNYDSVAKISSGTSLTNEQKIRQAENAYNMAKSNLDNSTELLGLDRQNTYKNALNSLSNAYIIARNSRDYLDSILWVTDLNKNKNMEFEVYLWARLTNSRSNAENSFRKFSSLYDTTYVKYEAITKDTSNLTKETLLPVLESALPTLEALRDALHDTMTVLDSSVTSTNFTNDMLNWMKSQVTTLLSNLEMAILSPTWAWVKWSLEAVEAYDASYDLKMKQLQDAFKIAEEDVNLARTWKDISSSDMQKNLQSLKTNISVKEDSLEIAKISMEQAQKWIDLTIKEKISKLAEIDANMSEIRSKLSEASTKKAEANMNAQMAANSIESWIIRAPFDWVITMRNYDVWWVVWAWMPVFQVSSTDKLLAKTYIDNSSYLLSVWDSIMLRLDDKWEVFSWSVLKIDNNKDLNTKKNYIEVNLPSWKITVWDRLTLLLSANNSEKRILIPVGSIISKYWQPWVFVVEWKKAKFKLIKIIDQDDIFAWVTWISKWEKVIVDWKDNIIDGEQL